MKALLNIDRSFWTNRNTLLFFTGTFTSKMANSIFLILMPWLVYDLTESAFSMGTMFLLESLPFIFIAPLAGVLADRLSRKVILFYCALLQSTLVTGLIIVSALNIMSVYVVYVTGFLLSCAFACFLVVNETIIPQLFSRKILVKVNSVFQFIETSTLLLGVAVAGLMIGFVGISGTLMINTVAFLIVCITFPFLRYIREEKVKVQYSSITQLKEGFQYVIKHPAIGPVALLTLVVNIGNACLIALLIFFARDQLNLSSTEVGWVYAIGAIAQFLAIFIVNLIHNKASSIKLMLCCQFLSALGIVYISFSFGIVGLMIGLAIQNCFTIMYNILNRTLRQQVVSEDILGRVNGIIIMMGRASFPLSGFMGGLLAEFFNVRSIFLVVGIGTFIIVALFWFSSFRHFDEKTYSTTEQAVNS
ncbi:MFS transporter [Bacillus alkalicellulosilyticus]|uniref:MFS transporter n=1 Tax=Alkalihalobacterium alkalicellulosilyticum TaxID=1912214 RepID=UPI000997941E|nr:MFS transporter [Bacillus alkalicellulosilyticus]